MGSVWLVQPKITGTGRQALASEQAGVFVDVVLMVVCWAA